MTSRLIVVNADALTRRRDLFARYLAAHRAAIDWLYADRGAIKAYAAWSGLPERIAAKAPEFLSRRNLDPGRIAGLDGIMADAVKFKYVPAPLSAAQLGELIQIPR